MTTADLSSSSPLAAARAVRAEIEAVCRSILGSGWEVWRLRGQLAELVRGLAEIERDPVAVAKFTAGGSLASGRPKKGRKGAPNT